MLIDVSRIIRRGLKGKIPTGIDRVLLAYLLHYSKSASGVMHWGPFTTVISNQGISRLAQYFEGGHSRPSRIGILTILLKSVLLPSKKVLTPNATILNIGHNGLDSAQYINWIKRHQLRLVAMIHDLIPITHPQFSRAHEDKRHQKRMKNALCNAYLLIYNSHSTQESFNQFAKLLDTPTPPGLVNHLPPAALKKSTLQSPLSSPYFLMLGTIEGRKNHALILNVWKTLSMRLGKACPKLVIIGQRGWECELVLQFLDQSNHLDGVVIEKNACSDGELAQWLSHAQALLFPSFIEGYGLPLLESFSLGTPVIASNLPVFQEIAGDIPLFLSPNSVDDWTHAVEMFCNTDSPIRQRQILLLQSYQAPSWNAHFKKLNDALIPSGAA
jgi:glycosyltransferase involved in cell wall biosynthesis